MSLLCFYVPGFYYTSLAKHNPAEPTSSSSSSSAAAVAGVSRDANDFHLDVQPYIISPFSRREANVPCRPAQRPAHAPLEPPLYRNQSVAATSKNSLNVVGADLQRSPIYRDGPCSWGSSAQVVPDTVVQRSFHRRRRRPEVVETSFIESSASSTPAPTAAVQRSDIAVQVSLPRRPAAPSSSVPHLPRMGKLMPVCHRKSTSSDNVDHSATALTTGLTDLGGSLPCLLGDELAPDQDRDCDVLVASALSMSTTSSSCPGTSRTSMSVKAADTTRSDAQLHCVDEGYLTKESNTSTSSADTSRYSPVFL